MRTDETITIGDRVYRRNPTVDRFQIPLSELGDLRMKGIPRHSHLEVLDVPMPVDDFECEMWIVHDGTSFATYGGASCVVTPETQLLVISRLRRAFPDTLPAWERGNPRFSVERNRGELQASVYLGQSFEADVLVLTAIDPFLRGFGRLRVPDVHVFICHASEDKPVVRELAEFIASQGAGVWLDEREIKVGESIVQRVTEGIEGASHLVVVLSVNSVTKPWVTRELSSALMRQLTSRAIAVLPLKLDDAPVPMLLTDIKYADCRADRQAGFRELVNAVLG